MSDPRITSDRLVRSLYLDNWPRRRRMLVLALLWLVGNAQYLIVFGDANSSLHQNALVTILGAIVALLGSYIFGAVWDDSNKRALGFRQKLYSENDLDLGDTPRLGSGDGDAT